MLRVLTLWLLVLALPVQSWAAVSMTHCQSIPGKAASQNASPHHDHAAMMQQMAQTPVSGDHSHHGHSAAQSAGIEDKAKTLGCECGCDCGGNCAMSCAASVTAFTADNPFYEWGETSLHGVLWVSQVMAAHRDTPLRPPSAAAL